VKIFDKSGTKVATYIPTLTPLDESVPATVLGKALVKPREGISSDYSVTETEKGRNFHSEVSRLH